MKEIPLTQGIVSLVDDDDYEWLSKTKWHAQKYHTGRFYAVNRGQRDANGKQRPRYMHREVLGLGRNDTRVVYHIDITRTLDNRKCNLRISTRTENARNRGKSSINTTGFKGVSFHIGKCSFISHIQVNGKLIHLGYFSTPQDAHAAYCKAAKQYHGAFANVGTTPNHLAEEMRGN